MSKKFDKLFWYKHAQKVMLIGVIGYMLTILVTQGLNEDSVLGGALSAIGLIVFAILAFVGLVELPRKVYFDEISGADLGKTYVLIAKDKPVVAAFAGFVAERRTARFSFPVPFGTETREVALELLPKFVRRIF